VKKKRSIPSRLSVRLALASLGTALAVGTVCAVGLSSLVDVAALTRGVVSRQLAVLDDSHAFGSLLYQKGFVAEYLLTGDRAWLDRLERNRPAFEKWLARTASDPPGHALLEKIQQEYLAYDQARRHSIALYDGGELAEAKATLADNYNRVRRLLGYFQELGRVERLQAEATLASSETSLRRLARGLVGTAIIGAVASLLAGFWWARRITKPIYELQVQIQSAAERTRIQIAPGGGDLDELAPRIAALVEKLEATDAELAEHRRRLIQSEKLSAVGELAAKLAHEVLNPLAGMKAAVQLLARQAERSGAPPAEASAAAGVLATVGTTAEALNREISRVEALVRRLVNYSRPLAPRFTVSTVPALVAGALEAAGPALSRSGAKVTERMEPDLPPLEVDPLLIVQALTNLLTNAVQAVVGQAGSPPIPELEVHASGVRRLGREEVLIAVTDNGPGLSAEQRRNLFHPFFTTKADGHGLGLAISHNILLEHGGRIEAGNRPAAQGSGAVFEVYLPIVR
jgi:signal transduction histidine kinase